MPYNETPMKGTTMLAIKALKIVTSSIVGVGTSKIVKTIITNNVEPETIVDVVTIRAGSIVIGAMVADATKQYTNDTIDKIVDIFKRPEEDEAQAED